MTTYHDLEWGVPSHDERHLFEMLILEGAQAGLSWSTILNKREGYRRAFAGFDPAKVASFTPRKIEQLLGDPGIVRNRAKVNAAITNARAFLETAEEVGSFDAYIWGWTGGVPLVNSPPRANDIPARSDLSDVVSKDLKRRGFGFVGSTIVYSYLQSIGVVNDHLSGCRRTGCNT